MELEKIKSYWNERAEGFSLANLEQLRTDAKDHWLAALRQHAPRKEKLKCLDVGCGPGFLAILLAKEGHDVTAVDYTEKMLEHAAKNAEAERVAIDLRRMDAQQLAFEDNSFDYIVSRNLTWNLEFPERAYAEWLRVLKPGGRILNFDGNHYLHHYDPLYKQFRESGAYADPHKKEHLQGVDTGVIERISRNLPLSKVERPAWDLSFFARSAARKIASEIERRPFANEAGQPCSIIQSFYVCVEK